jgi:hypothetical protein
MDFKEKNKIVYNLTQRILADCNEKAIDIRLFGSVALLFLDSTKFDWISQNRKPIADIDVVVKPNHVLVIEEYFINQGYEINRQVRMLYGNQRRSFHSKDNISIDIFIGNIFLCQEINILDRFELSYPTISITDLFLTKIQKMKLSESDIFDIDFILNYSIDTEYVAKLCTNNWNWWKTLNVNIPILLNEKISSSNKVVLNNLLNFTNSKKKNIHWQVRNFAGDKIQWYNIVE